MDGRETTLEHVSGRAVETLARKYGVREAKAMVRIIFEQLKGWGPVETAVNADKPLSEYICGKVDDTVRRLLGDEPIQYIFGTARFYGMDLKVTGATLIPRPETASLVDMIVSENHGTDLRVLDIGTGSGCIAIALARNLRFPSVTATDISQEALDVAKENAKALKAAGIRFIRADMTAVVMEGQEFDIIVSNPPYIAESERASMERNVLDHEPASALFVPDDDPLKFYKAIADIATASLAPDGRLYLEINPLFAGRLAGMLESKGLSPSEIIKDTEGRDRFIKTSKKR